MSQVTVQWVDIQDMNDDFRCFVEGQSVKVVTLASLAEVVEGLRALDRMCAAHKIQDVDAHAVIYKLLTQLEAHRKGGA